MLQRLPFPRTHSADALWRSPNETATAQRRLGRPVRTDDMQTPRSANPFFPPEQQTVLSSARHAQPRRREAPTLSYTVVFSMCANMGGTPMLSTSFRNHPTASMEYATPKKHIRFTAPLRHVVSAHRGIDELLHEDDHLERHRNQPASKTYLAVRPWHCCTSYPLAPATRGKHPEQRSNSLVYGSSAASAKRKETSFACGVL